MLSTRIQLALRRARTADEHEATLRELAHDVTALSALAEQLLRLSTNDVTHSPGEGSGSDLAAVAADVVRAHRAHGASPLSYGGHPADAGLRVEMPDARLRQVLTNLVDNALLHGEEAAVRVRVVAVDGTAVLTVTDEGPGVRPGFLPTAADRFARADTARARAGAGLGLSLVRGLVHGCGGELRMCSSGVHHRYAERFPTPCVHPASGTTVSVLLPRL